MKIILGSNSPRRIAILNSIKAPFKIFNNNFNEDLIKIKDRPDDYVKEISKAKAESIKPLIDEDCILICADTIVFMDDKIYLKPKDLDEAFSTLKKLSGRTHFVYSGICLTYKNHFYTEYDKTEVTLKKLSEKKIATYFKLMDPMDKAGAYAIQGAGSLIISQIKGCYYNVMGLPVGILDDLFQKAGFDLWDILEENT